MNDTSKNFRKRIAVLGAAALVEISGLAGMVSCINNNAKNNNNNLNNDSSISASLHNNTNYFQRSEIFKTYSYIVTSLEKKGELSTEKILELCNTYKKLISSINYIDETNYLYSGERTFVVDTLPYMDGLYTDMRNDLVSLLNQSSLLKLPNNTLNFQKEIILEKYLSCTDYVPLKNVHIIQLSEDNRYCVLSSKNNLCFEIHISPYEDETIRIKPQSNLKNLSELYSKSISITEVTKEIPIINFKDLEQDLER